MRRTIWVSVLGLALAAWGVDCSGSSGSTGGTTPTGSGAGSSCQSAGAAQLVGSCDLTGLSSCFEEYSVATVSADVAAAASQGCAGGTWATTGCPTAGVVCKCTDTEGAYKMVTYYQDQTACAGACAGSCKTTSP